MGKGEGESEGVERIRLTIVFFPQQEKYEWFADFDWGEVTRLAERALDLFRCREVGVQHTGEELRVDSRPKDAWVFTITADKSKLEGGGRRYSEKNVRVEATGANRRHLAGALLEFIRQHDGGAPTLEEYTHPTITIDEGVTDDGNRD